MNTASDTTAENPRFEGCCFIVILSLAPWNLRNAFCEESSFKKLNKEDIKIGNRLKPLMRRTIAYFLKGLEGETRVIIEYTGRYYEPVAQVLHEIGI